MSKLRLNGTSSGYVEIAAPATGANNTITLPSTTGSVVVQGTSGITSFTSGPVFVGSGTSTGTASQTLQVTGGAYISGNLGIGTSNPTDKIHVFGGVSIENTDNAYIVLNSGKGATAGNQVNYIDFKLDGTLKGNIAVNEAVSGNPLELNSAVSSNINAVTGGGNFGIGGASAGQKFFVYQTSNSRTAAFHADSASYPELIVFAQALRSASTAFHYFFAYNASTADTEFRVDGNGTVFGDNNYVTGADYAEYFEWEDGNPNDEDRRGYSVSLIGNKIKIAEEGEQIIGVISANPSVVGDSAWNKWSGKYLTDDFGSYIFEEHNVVEWTDEDGKERSYEDWNLPEDVVVPEDAVIKTHDEKGNRFIHRKVNPEYNPNQEYIPREERKEWDAVGMMGKLRLRKGQLTGPNWIKLQDISATVEEWLVR